MLDPAESKRSKTETAAQRQIAGQTGTDPSQTSLSLLARLRDEPDASPGWDEFVRRYQPRIAQWCRRWGLQASDAEDVSQNVMLELSKQMRKFEYQPGGRFRAWLKTITRRAWYDYTLRRKRSEYQADKSDLWKQLESSDAESDLVAALDEECHRELLQTAMTNVRSRVKSETWTSFEATEFGGRSANDVAQELGIQRASVYVARGRVQKMIVNEVKRLDQMV